MHKYLWKSFLIQCKPVVCIFEPFYFHFPSTFIVEWEIESARTSFRTFCQIEHLNIAQNKLINRNKTPSPSSSSSSSKQQKHQQQLHREPHADKKGKLFFYLYSFWFLLLQLLLFCFVLVCFLCVYRNVLKFNVIVILSIELCHDGICFSLRTP